jgi:uncharacterized SAM-binding protein YcdF (DUF218 family)
VPSSRFHQRWLLLLVCIGVVAATYPLWCSAIGHFLVKADSPTPADIAIVLAGDRAGNRMLKGMELVRQGYAPLLLVSGPRIYYGAHESDLAIAFALRRGFPAERLIPFPHEALSTRSELRAIIPELRRRSIRHCLLVTSDFHTRRSGSLFRLYAPDIRLTVVAAPDEFFSPGNWWRTRDGRKRTFEEVTKTIADAFGGL